jgi:hypothetical protein
VTRRFALPPAGSASQSDLILESTVSRSIMV